jgi:hypothetical protein
MAKETIIATIDVPVELMNNLKDIAAYKNIDFQELAISYFEDGARQDLGKVRWCDFICHAKELLVKYNAPPEAMDDLVDKFKV